MVSTDKTDCGIATGKPAGFPSAAPIRSMSEERDCGVVKVTMRPIPADSKPSGMGGGEGWIVLRV